MSGRSSRPGTRYPGILVASFQLQEGCIVFRIPLDSPTDEDLRTG